MGDGFIKAGIVPDEGEPLCHMCKQLITDEDVVHYSCHMESADNLQSEIKNLQSQLADERAMLDWLIENCTILDKNALWEDAAFWLQSRDDIRKAMKEQA